MKKCVGKLVYTHSIIYRKECRLVISTHISNKKDITIRLENVTKQFKVLDRRGGLCGSIKDLFAPNYNVAKAVNNVSLAIREGELVGFLGPNGA